MRNGNGNAAANGVDGVGTGGAWFPGGTLTLNSCTYGEGDTFVQIGG